jgi:hypothetical protein
MPLSGRGSPVARLVALTSTRALAARERARLDARAAVTARLNELPWDGVAMEACWCSLPAALDEWTELTWASLASAPFGRRSYGFSFSWSPARP